MQYGALTPFCRNHAAIGAIDQYVWSWGEPNETYQRRAIELRYRLMPYLYACFLTASETGAPVQRPLVFDHQDDPTVRDLDDEYLLGPDLLVAPVLEPGITTRRVYLPDGEWHDWATGDMHEGRTWLDAPTPMHRIPLYARAGAVVPMWSHAPVSTAGFHPKTLELHVFVPSRDGTHRSFVQEDDGVTFAAAAGAYVRTTFELARASSRITVSARAEGAGFPELARTAYVVVVHGAQPSAAEVDGAPVELGERDGLVVLELANAGEGFELALSL
jgi:alpha-glucosidase